ncbi:hypothetical protein [Desulfoluna sp.]|uniref:hypothetical protein n=1 Tax=Desulfoluna sp. TaxID=2045199 RepID=UPI0026224DCC|nr:hypothetical protein [Desulfoluna sp.]
MNNCGFFGSAKKMRTVLATALLVFFILAVAGCGGGSDYDQISGVAAKGLIRYGTVNIFEIDESGAKGDLLETTMTNADGRYSVMVRHAMRLYVEVTGGAYIDEATGDEIDRGEHDVLRAVVAAHADGELTVAVTDLTEVAVRIAEKMDGGLTAANIVSSNTKVSRILGVDASGAPVMDITTVNPVDITDPNAFDDGDENQQRYAKMLAVLSQAAENDTAKESGEILDDLAAYMGGNAPVGSVSMAPTLTQAAGDFFKAENKHNATGETDFHEIQTAVSQARYTPSKRVVGISVFKPAGDEPKPQEDEVLMKASFLYDGANNLSKVHISDSIGFIRTFLGSALENSVVNVDLKHKASGALASLTVTGENGESLLNLDNTYNDRRQLDTALVNKGGTDFLTAKFRGGNLYDIASCVFKGFTFQTSLDQTGRMENLGIQMPSFNQPLDARIWRLPIGRVDRVLFVPGSAPRVLEDSFCLGGDWFGYDASGTLETVIAVFGRGTAKDVDSLATACLGAKDLDNHELQADSDGFAIDAIQYTEYHYRPGENGGKEIERIDVKFIINEDEDITKFSVLFKECTGEGLNQRIELHKTINEKDRLMSYAVVTCEEGQMKRNVWGDALTDVVRIGYRNVFLVLMSPRLFIFF